MPSFHLQLCPSQALGVTAKPFHLRCWGWEDQPSHFRHFPAVGSSASSDARNCKGRGDRGQGHVGAGFGQTTHLASLLSTHGDCSQQWGGKPGRAVPIMASWGSSERPGQKGEEENIPKTIRDAGLRWAELHPPVPCTAQSGSLAPTALLPQAPRSHFPCPGQGGSGKDQDLFLAQIPPSSNK